MWWKGSSTRVILTLFSNNEVRRIILYRKNSSIDLFDLPRRLYTQRDITPDFEKWNIIYQLLEGMTDDWIRLIIMTTHRGHNILLCRKRNRYYIMTRRSKFLRPPIKFLGTKKPVERFGYLLLFKTYSQLIYNDLLVLAPPTPSIWTLLVAH